ncbi:MAG: hypothetical protein NVS3B12_29760 [Acidimicrobiales bacterium]
MLALTATSCASGRAPGTTGPHPAAVAAAPTRAVSAVATITSGLQEDLRRLGYDPGGLTGTFNAATTAALVRFQTDAALPEKGALGPATARTLVAKRAAASGAVRALQSALTDVGLFGGSIDGKYGDDLLAAVQRLQQQAAIPVDGQYGTQTADALDRLYRQKVPTAPIVENVPSPTSSSTSEQATTSTTNPDNLLQLGSTSPKVTALQQRLAALGYRPGTPDGFFGAATASAVLAYQKHEGLPRDGIAGPVVQGEIFAPPKGAGPHPGLPTPRIEVDLARQIAFVVLAGQPVVTLNVSTGSNAHYTDPGPGGGDDVAYTPVGTFGVERKIDADEKAPLGTLHRPLYFYKGWAVHGAASVPAYPASHGCVRVSNDDADWLFPQIAPATAVVIYDPTGKNPNPGQAPAGATPGY